MFAIWILLQFWKYVMLYQVSEVQRLSLKASKKQNWSLNVLHEDCWALVLLRNILWFTQVFLWKKGPSKGVFGNLKLPIAHLSSEGHLFWFFIKWVRNDNMCIIFGYLFTLLYIKKTLSSCSLLYILLYSPHSH